MTGRSSESWADMQECLFPMAGGGGKDTTIAVLARRMSYVYRVPSMEHRTNGKAFRGRSHRTQMGTLLVGTRTPIWPSARTYKS